jgi:hypothetical protein
MTAHKCPQTRCEIAVAEQGVGHSHSAEDVVREAASTMEQCEVARRSPIALKSRADDVPCDRAEHAGPSQRLRQSQLDIGRRESETRLQWCFKNCSDMKWMMINSGPTIIQQPIGTVHRATIQLLGRGPPPSVEETWPLKSGLPYFIHSFCPTTSPSFKALN